jgi:hypothetical protein
LIGIEESKAVYRIGAEFAEKKVKKLGDLRVSVVKWF